MGSRVTQDPETDVPIIDLDSSQSVEEQLAEPEVVNALAGVVAAEPAEVDDVLEDAAATEQMAEPVTAELVPVHLNRHQSPSKAATAWIATELERSRITIEGVIVDDEGRHWQGVTVIPWPTALAILATVPDQHPMHAELVTGGDLYTATPCPLCGETIRHRVVTYGDVRIQGKKGIREVKPTFGVRWKAHVCGQAELPLADTVPSQTEAFPTAAPDPAPAPERTAPIPVVPAEDVVRLADRVEREELLVDRPDVGIPPEEEIATWSPDDLGLAYEYLWSVVHNEPERPPVPTVLLRERPVVATIDGEPVGCSHEGAGLPDCPVCFPVVETPLGEAMDGGTGDPDGDLLA